VVDTSSNRDSGKARDGRRGNRRTTLGLTGGEVSLGRVAPDSPIGYAVIHGIILTLAQNVALHVY